MRESGRNAIIFFPKGIRWNKIERGAGDEAEPLNSPYLLVHVVSIKWRVALAQQKPVHISQYIIYDDIAVNSAVQRLGSFVHGWR